MDIGSGVSGYDTSWREQGVVIPKHTPYYKYFVVEVHNTTSTNYTVYSAGYQHSPGQVIYDTSVQAIPKSFKDLDLDRLQYAGNLFSDIEANFTPS